MPALRKRTGNPNVDTLNDAITFLKSHKLIVEVRRERDIRRFRCILPQDEVSK